MRRLLRKRLGQRGAVAVEFAFSLFFLVPLLLATLDYGYYFWISVNAVQAANAGLRAATSTPGVAPGCNSSAASIAAVLLASQNASTAVTAQITGGTPPRTPLTTSNITLLYNGCVTVAGGGATDPNWKIQVQVDFDPIVGFLDPWMPRNGSPPPAAGKVRFRSPILFGGGF